jgi:hypothetical protein
MLCYAHQPSNLWLVTHTDSVVCSPSLIAQEYNITYTGGNFVWTTHAASVTVNGAVFTLPAGTASGTYVYDTFIH